MQGLLERVKPLSKEWMELDNERLRLELEYMEIYTKYNEGKLSNEELINVTDTIDEQLKNTVRKRDSLYEKINNYGQYGHCFIGAYYEVAPTFTFVNGKLPLILIFYWKIIEKIKSDYNTDKVEFICFRNYDDCGGKGVEFSVDGKRIFGTVKTNNTRFESEIDIVTMEITPDMKSNYFEIFSPSEENRKSWEKFEDEFYEDEG